MGNLQSVLVSPAGLLVILAVIGYIIYSFGYAPYTVLKKCGIKGPIPRAFVGNLALQKQGFLKLNQDLRKYGPVAGHYYGCNPTVMVADPNILETILIKKSDNFRDRVVFSPYIFSNEGLPDGLFVATGDSWWKMRSALKPLFPTDNIQMISNLIQRSCDALVRKLGEHSDTGKSVDLYSFIFNYSTEMCLATMYGREVKIQDGETDDFMDAIKLLFDVPDDDDIRSTLPLLILQSNFPCFKHVFGKLFPFTAKGKAFHTMVTTTTEWLKSKKQATAPPKYKDMMQLMMDKGFTDVEIVSQTINSTIGVYLNLTNGLAYTLYLLAINPSVQDRLCSEIKQFFQSNPRASAYDATQELEYLDMVMLESVRILSPVPRLNRKCLQTTEFGDFKIPAGAGVEVPIDLVHHDPQIWPDPLTFDPDRHTPEKKAKRPRLSLLHFGAGPRECTGKQLAPVMLKMAVVETLQKYKLIQAADTEVPLKTILKLIAGALELCPKNKIYLKIASHDQ